MKSEVKPKIAKGFIEGKYDPNPEAEEEINICDNATVDAMFILYNDNERTEYVFKGAYYWKVVKDKLVTPDYPRLICDTWLGVPDNIDAAFTYKNNQIVFFKGDKFWQFTGTKRNKGYPKLIKDGFPGIPDNIQAATIWGHTDYIYFFKGNQYWRFESGRKPPVRKGYPKLIKDVWEGVPDNLDEALLYSDGVTYFLKGIRYWTFNDEKLRTPVGTSANSLQSNSAGGYSGVLQLWCNTSTSHCSWLGGWIWDDSTGSLKTTIPSSQTVVLVAVMAVAIHSLALTLFKS